MRRQQSVELTRKQISTLDGPLNYMKLLFSAIIYLGMFEHMHHKNSCKQTKYIGPECGIEVCPLVSVNTERRK